MKRLRDKKRQTFARHRAVMGLIFSCLILIGNQNLMAEDRSPAPRRDINAVLRDHDQELLAIKDVVGVYVGLQADGRTPCLHVMLKRDSAEARNAIPSEIEGYRVVVEITGDIRPLPGQSASPR